MKKLFIVNSDFDTGGASFIARKLYVNAKKVLADYDVNVFFISGRHSSDKLKDKNIIYVNNKLQLIGNVLSQRLFAKDFIFSKCQWENKIKLNFNLDSLVHLHNLHGYYFPLNTLASLKEIKTIWTVHDFWALTGNCTSPNDCSERENYCKSCPSPEYYPATIQKKFKNTFIEKQNLIKSINDLTVVAPSVTVKRVYEQENTTFPHINVISGGVNTDCFFPTKSIEDKYKIYQKLELEPTKNLTFCFSSRKLNDLNKGFSILEKSLDLIRKPFRLILIGEKPYKYTRSQQSIDIIFTGYLSDQSKIADYYRISDWFIGLSKSETFGLSVMEAYSCGLNLLLTPLPIFIENLKDRALFLSESDSNNLANSMNDILSNNQTVPSFPIKNFKHVVDNFSLNQLVFKYIDLYKKGLQLN